MSTPKYVLPVIVYAQFAGTSLWFAGNAVVNNLIAELGLAPMFLGYITTSVQAGFILGTLVFAVLNIADRYSPILVFFLCSLFGALINLSIIFLESAILILFARFFTGFFLAGIYPVGMKIASDWHQKGLGKALGYLVGALVLGTAFPHVLKYLGANYPWRFVFKGTSILAFSGGLLILSLKDGPYRSANTNFKLGYRTIVNLFRNENFKSVAFGYFGHMWELYTFWAFIPLMLTYYLKIHSNYDFSIPLWSFLIIGIGSLGCAIGGHLSENKSSQLVSKIALIGSGLCCLLLPFSFQWPQFVFLILMLAWGFFVIPDSPQFSSLVAKSSDPSLVATGLTIVNSLGFAVTILSIQLVNYVWCATLNPIVFLIIAIGPLFGLLYLKKYKP